MTVLKWFCFILVCLDTLSYIMEKADKIGDEKDQYSKVGRFVGLCIGIAARVFVLCGTASGWLLV